jgi:flagellar secretion chaperone FliS
MTLRNLAKARDHYAQLELASRLDSAGPHALVGILYEELMRSLDVLIAAHGRERPLGNELHTARATSILIALGGSLDLDSGGEVARSLDTVYRAMNAQLRRIVQTADGTRLVSLRSDVAMIAAAWAQVGKT